MTKDSESIERKTRNQIGKRDFKLGIKGIKSNYLFILKQVNVLNK